MGIFDNWKDDEDILDETKDLLVPADGKSKPNDKKPIKAPESVKKAPEEASQEIVPIAAKALKPYAKMDSTKVEECVNVVKEINEIYSDLEKHSISEAEQTNRVYIESMREVNIASINASAAVQQAYYEYEKVREECEKEIGLKKLDFEKDKLVHERIMKMLNIAKEAFIKSLENYELSIKENIKQEEDWLAMIKKEKNYKRFEKLIDSFLELKDKNSKGLDLIAELRIQLLSLPEE